MSKYGVNVPPGIPVFKVDEVLPAAQKMADDEGQVCLTELIMRFLGSIISKNLNRVSMAYCDKSTILAHSC
jgi:hypothetical protein